MNDMPSRFEQLKFLLTLDKTKATRHKQAAELILGKKLPEDVVDGDTLKLTYALYIEYWGDVVTKLKALKRILDDPDVVVTVSTEELKHGNCLIQEVFEQIVAVREQIAKRRETQ